MYSALMDANHVIFNRYAVYYLYAITCCPCAYLLELVARLSVWDSGCMIIGILTIVVVFCFDLIAFTEPACDV